MATKHVHKQPGKSHIHDQPVQYVAKTKTRDGEEIPDVVCRVEVISVIDGAPRAVIDDGHRDDGSRPDQDNSARAALRRLLNTRDADGHPVFFVREKLKDWQSGVLTERGSFKTMKCLPFPVLDDEALARMREKNAARADFLSNAAGHAGLVDKAVVTASDPTIGKGKVKA